MSSPKSYAVTGHQPHLLGGFGSEAASRLVLFAQEWIYEKDPKEIITGMAPGWDLAMAEAAHRCGVPYIAALAWPGQGNAWLEGAKANLSRLLEGADLVHVSSEKRSDEHVVTSGPVGC